MTEIRPPPPPGDLQTQTIWRDTGLGLVLVCRKKKKKSRVLFFGGDEMGNIAQASLKVTVKLRTLNL